MSRLISDQVWGLCTVWQEARGELQSGRIAVAEVILTRTKLKLMSDGTVAGTCLWPFQFSGWRTEDKANKIGAAKLDWDDPVVKECQSAWNIAAGGSSLARGATHYLNLEFLQSQGKVPSWFRPEFVVATHGHHTFLKLL